MLGRFLISLAAAAVLTFVGTEALGAAITPAPLKIIATVVAHPHPVSANVARS
ncbi:MAG TPA: hypothetical protein VK702_04920 [Candidatus Acidoferrum sp.]|jgi:hypothetical protein|nr:hypothetical protein [Candidatus Acidoferrum sp.]